MRRNPKALGLALVAVLVMSAVASSAASATEATFTSETNWTTLDVSAVGSHVFKVEGEAEEMVCNSISFHNATVGTDQNSITATPTYGTTLENKATEAEATTSGCTILAGGVTRPMTVHTENCHLTLTAGSNSVTSDGEIHITDTSVPPATCVLGFTIYFLGEFRPCFDIHDQTPTVPTVDYINGTYIAGGVNKWDFKIKSTIKGVTYHRTGVCLGAHPTEANDLEYKGEVTVKGTSTLGTAASVTWDPKT